MWVKPNFFIIGAPKAGTTALSEYLRSHNNVYFSQPKEPAYFATDFRGRIINSFNGYMKLFKNADLSTHKAIGEGSTLYLYSNEAVVNILKFQPKAKLIISVRNPVDLVISLHAELLKNGAENEKSFLKAWELEKARKKGMHIPLSCRDVKVLFYSERGKLGSQIKRVLSIVPREQIKMILFDDLVTNPGKVYREVLDFLDLADDGRKEFPIVNERVWIKHFTFHRVLITLWRFWLPLRRRINGGKGLGIVSYITNKWNSIPSDKKIDPEVYESLISFYEDEVVILEELLNRDLAHWREFPKVSFP